MKKLLFIPFFFLIFEVSAQNVVSKQTPVSQISVDETNSVVLPAMPLKEISDEELLILSRKKRTVIQTSSSVEETTIVNLTGTLKPLSSEELEKLSQQKKEVIILNDSVKSDQPVIIELKAKLIPVE